MEDPLSAIAVNNSVLFWVNQEPGGQRELEKYQKQEAGASHSGEPGKCQDCGREQSEGDKN